MIDQDRVVTETYVFSKHGNDYRAQVCVPYAEQISVETIKNEYTGTYLREDSYEFMDLQEELIKAIVFNDPDPSTYAIDAINSHYDL